MGDRVCPRNVQVVCRVRPMNDKERYEGDATCVSLDGNGTTIDVLADNMGSARQTFSFDHVFGYDATQAEIYDFVGKSVVEGLFEGYNGTIFAYGQVRKTGERAAWVTLVYPVSCTSTDRLWQDVHDGRCEH
jgi:hypothetical protein